VPKRQRGDHQESSRCAVCKDRNCQIESVGHRRYTAEELERESDFCFPGIHAEGPIVASLGAMPPSDTQMSDSDFERFLSALPGLRVMTISPSVEVDKHFLYTLLLFFSFLHFRS